jgi:methionine-rich copper-binding protein CopC
MAAILALLTVFALPTAASAHDQLISSDPAADAQLETAPTTITLEFSAAIMTTGLAMTVVDADGTDHLADAPIADGTTVTATLDTLPVGGYQVRWRVVSSDGHPISGYVPFTVGDAEPLPVPTAGEDTASDEDTATADHDETITTAGTDSAAGSDAGSDDPAVLRTVLIGAAGAIVAVGVLVVIVVLNRRSRRGDDARDNSTPDTTATTDTTDTTDEKAHS